MFCSYWTSCCEFSVVLLLKHKLCTIFEVPQTWLESNQFNLVSLFPTWHVHRPSTDPVFAPTLSSALVLTKKHTPFSFPTLCSSPCLKTYYFWEPASSSSGSRDFFSLNRSSHRVSSTRVSLSFSCFIVTEYKMSSVSFVLQNFCNCW